MPLPWPSHREEKSGRGGGDPGNEVHQTLILAEAKGAPQRMIHLKHDLRTVCTWVNACGSSRKLPINLHATLFACLPESHCLAIADPRADGSCRQLLVMLFVLRAKVVCS